jgi:hypothetical protein
MEMYILEGLERMKKMLKMSVLYSREREDEEGWSVV